MNICMQLLIYAVVSKSDRQQLRAHWRERRREFIERHIIADAPEWLDEWEQEQDLKEKNDSEKNQ